MTLDLEQNQNHLSETTAKLEASEQTLLSKSATSASEVDDLNRKLDERDAKISELDSQLEVLRSEMKSRSEDFLAEKSDLTSKLVQAQNLQVSFGHSEACAI